MKPHSFYQRSVLIVSGGFLLALLPSHLTQLYAAEGAGIANVEPHVGRAIEPNEPPQIAIPRDVTGLVGPSAGEIHDFLYPPAADGDGASPTEVEARRP